MDAAKTLRSRFIKYVWLAMFVLILGICILFLTQPFNVSSAAEWVPPKPLDTRRAMSTIVKVCSFGPRVSGTLAMQQQQDWLQSEFTKLHGKVEFQEFQIRHPGNGSTVTLKNMIVHYGPENGERLLFCAHYDTRPFPDEDRSNPKGKFVGANDGASGVALMLELANSFAEKAPAIGVDLILFDAEEFIFRPNVDPYFIGSEYFARDYIAQNKLPAVRYKAGVLVDMIGDRFLELYYEVNSFGMARSVTIDVWEQAAKLKINAFVPRLGHTVRDDHLALNQIARIPVCDIIDFDYPSRGRRGVSYWHTTEDTPEKCSGESVCKVAAVLLAWISAEAQVSKIND